MEKIIFKNSNQFRNLIRFLKELSSDINIFISDNILLVQTNDIFDKIFIESYIEIDNTYSENRNFSFNINIIHLYRILLSATRLSKISFTYYKEELIFEFQNNNITKKTIFPINYKSSEIQNFNHNYQYMININTRELYNIITKCSVISNIIYINILQNSINFSSKGNEASVNINKKINFPENININLSFELKKLLFICKLYKISKKLQLRFEEKKPLQIYVNDNNINVNIILLQSTNINNDYGIE